MNILSLTEAIETYGYLAIFLGSVFEGETIVLLGGFASHGELLYFPFVLLIAILGAIFSDTAWFLLGRKHGKNITSRFPRIERLSRKPQKFINAYPKLISFSVRFFYGFRHIVPFSIGLSNIPMKQFFLYNTLGAILWGCIFTTTGFLLGETIENIFGSYKRAGFILILIAVFIVACVHSISRLISFIIQTNLENRIAKNKEE